MKLDSDIQKLMNESVLCWLATADGSGQPNVSPKEIFLPFNNDSIIIANIASPNSARNLRANPRACVSFVDVFTQRGYQVSGSAQVLRKGDESFAEAEQALLELTSGNFPFKVIFRVMANEVREVVAPRYRLFPETTEEEQVASAMNTYGVQPRVSEA